LERAGAAGAGAAFVEGAAASDSTRAEEEAVAAAAAAAAAAAGGGDGVCERDYHVPEKVCMDFEALNALKVVAYNFRREGGGSWIPTWVCLHSRQPEDQAGGSNRAAAAEAAAQG
jgi:hypothetical protein